MNIKESEYSKENYLELQKNINENIYFDARIFSLSHRKDVVENIIWRNKHDCLRNSKQQLGFFFF
jgi:hypothetical protein